VRLDSVLRSKAIRIIREKSLDSVGSDGF